MDEKLFLTSKTIAGNVQQRSEMAQEIISHQPGAFEKWFLVIFSGILLLIAAATWFIRYPDVIETHAILTATNAPKEIVARKNGRIVRLLVQNNQQVQQNTIIAWLESTADHQAVICLAHQLDSVALLGLDDVRGFNRIFDQHYSNLGELQPAYQDFVMAWRDFSDYLINGFYLKKRTKIAADITSLHQIMKTNQEQKILIEKDYELSDETFSVNKKLFEEKVLSRDELRREESKWVSKKMAILQMENSLQVSEVQQRERIKELEQLDHDIAQQRIIFNQAVQSLKSAIDEWKLQNILQAPIEGTIVFTIPLQENQFLTSGKLLGFINPGLSSYYAETVLPQGNFGKMAEGLEVQLRFAAYPYQESGFVSGTLDYISNVPSDSGFLATIKLNRGLLTSNGKTLSYRSGLKAQAVIITKDMRLLERFYYNMVKSASVGSK